MKFQFKFFLLFLLSSIIICSFLSYFSKPPKLDYIHNTGYEWEEYKPNYFHKFQTIQSVIDDANQEFPSDKRTSAAYYEYIAKIIRQRFYHGYSHYAFADNPFAFLAGRLIWNHLSAIVIPDDIMKYPMAACSQQSMVLMEIFKRTNINYRNVKLNSHYAVEAKIEGKWLYFDTNMEPDFKNKRESFENLVAHKRIDTLYSKFKLDSIAFHKAFQLLQYGEINATPALQARLFHKACFILHSKITTALLLLVILFIVRHSVSDRQNNTKRFRTANI